MAVYKATYCYPFLTSYDVRLASFNTFTGQAEKPVKWLSCKVDSSNKTITGYSIRILNEYNEVIFPVEGHEYISPISELKADLNNGVYQLGGVDLLNQEWKVNTGLNGTYLNIPFFQAHNRNSVILKSVNAIYSTIDYRVNYIIRPMSASDNITELSDKSESWIKEDNGYKCTILGWKGTLNGDYLVPGQTVLVLNGDSNDALTGNICKVVDDVNALNLQKIDIIPGNNQTILIDQGAYHNQIYRYKATGLNFQRVEDDYIRYRDGFNHGINLNNLGSVYKWEITLYQGDGEIVTIEKGNVAISYKNLNKEKYCDMTLLEGTVLGSKPGRLQIAYLDNGKKEDEILPQNKDGSGVLLYHKWAQLLTSDGADASNRFYVNSYDENYGHVYPLESDANTLSLNGVSKVQFFPHSNDPTSVTADDRVDMAASTTDGQISGTSTLVATGNVELVGVQDLDGVPGFSGAKVLLMHQKRPEENGVYVMASDVNNTITVNGVTYTRNTSIDNPKPVGGKNLWFSFGWTNTKDGNGTSVYTRTRYVRKPVTSGYAGDIIYTDAECTIDSGHKATEVSMTIWSRAGAFDTWGDFIGKIVYVENGTENGHKNFDSLANAGGQLLVAPYKTYNTQGDYNYDGSSNLYFTVERPILLFSQKLENYNIRACGARVDAPGSISYDGVVMKDGQYALQIDNNKATIKKISVVGSTSSATEVTFDFAQNAPHYFYVEEGQQNGHSVVKVDDKGNATLNNTDLYTATILYNKKDRTYISPFTGLAEQMLLQFKGNVIQLENNQYKQSTLSITGVHKTLWYITHDNLINPLLSYLPIQNTTSDEIPYKYRLTTFFKTSDENPFYLYEDPYVGIYRAALLDSQILSTKFDVLDTTAQPSGSTDFVVYNSKKGFKAPNGKDFDVTTTDWDTIRSDFLGYDVTKNNLAETIAFHTDITNNSTVSINFSDYYTGNFLQESNKKPFTSDILVEWRTQHPNPTSKDLEKFMQDYGIVWIDGADAINFPATPGVEPTPLSVNVLILDLTSGYRLNLIGMYNQQQGGSWEAYRWVVSKPTFRADYTFDSNNLDDALANVVSESVLQDTGRRYDKEINVNFYGLFAQENNNGISKTPYLVHLYLEDNLGNVVHKKEIVVVESGSPNDIHSQYLSEFTATFDKCNACVDITVGTAWRDTEGKLTNSGLESFSIFRREYRQMYKNGVSNEIVTIVGDQWYPVALNITVDAQKAANKDTFIKVKDYNVKNGYSYQYIIFPNVLMKESATTTNYIYANTPVKFGGTFATIDEQFNSDKSKPVEINFNYWSLVELIPNEELIDAPIAASSYTIDPANIWLFKYALDTGSLSQTMAKNEINTLGQFNRYGHGLRNTLSGSVSCYLGSEIVPLSKAGYLERMPYARNQPISTNDANTMLLLWRQLAYSKNPKLLRNLKGESWIVQITESSNTTNNFVHNYPDTINFSWKQIEKTDTAIISLVDSKFFEENLTKKDPTKKDCDPIWDKQIVVNDNIRQQLLNRKVVAKSIEALYNMNK